MILGGVHSQFISSHRGDTSSIYCVDWAPDECIVCVCTYTFTMDYSFTLLNWCWISFSSSSGVFFHPVKTIFVSLLYSFQLFFLCCGVCIVCCIETSCCHRLVCAHLLSKGTNQRTRLSKSKIKKKGKRGFAWKGFRVTDSWQRGMRRSQQKHKIDCARESNLPQSLVC